MEISKDVLERMRKRFEELQRVTFENFPEIPPCAKCGRVIYCGAHMCSNVDCPNKVKHDN